MTKVTVDKSSQNPGNFCRHGALLINKLAGCTSFDVIRQIQRDFAKNTGISRKNQPSFGHTGTLDPFATGLLVVCVGHATKLVQYLTGCQKTYEAEVCFGTQTDTADHTGQIVGHGAIPADGAPIAAAARSFEDAAYLQTPPMYSAKQIGGVRLHALARTGQTVERAPVPCQIMRFDITAYAPPRAQVVVTCSAGTYIRTLAEDLAARLGTVAHLTALHRTAVGRWCAADALAPAEAAAWLAGGESAAPHWIPFDRLLDDFPRVDIDAPTVAQLIAGQQGGLDTLLAAQSHDAEVALYHGDQLIAVAAHEPRGWRLQRVFAL